MKIKWKCSLVQDSPRGGLLFQNCGTAVKVIWKYVYPCLREKVERDNEYHLQFHGKETHTYFALVFKDR